MFTLLIYGPVTLPVTDDATGDRTTLPRLPRPTTEHLDQYVEALRMVSHNAGALTRPGP